MYNLIDLTDKRFIVTGASSGIGKQTAITLSRLGAKVILIARRQELLQENMQLLEGSGHGYRAGDLSDIASIEYLVKDIVSHYGKLDGMAYAAGVSWELPLRVDNMKKMQEMFDINYFGFIEMVKQITKKPRRNEKMRIVGISSTAAFCGDAALTTYSASKAAMDSAVRCLANELAANDICINTIAPAMTRTDMYKDYLGRIGEESENYSLLLKRQYLGLAEPQDIANAVAFLLSPAARFITGVCLPVDGGYTAS